MMVFSFQWQPIGAALEEIFFTGEWHVKQKYVFTLLDHLLVLFHVNRLFAVCVNIIFIHIPVYAINLRIHCCFREYVNVLNA